MGRQNDSTLIIFSSANVLNAVEFGGNHKLHIFVTFSISVEQQQQKKNIRRQNRNSHC